MSVALCFLCFIAAPFVWCGLLMFVLYIVHRLFPKLLGGHQ